VRSPHVFAALLLLIVGPFSSGCSCENTVPATSEPSVGTTRNARPEIAGEALALPARGRAVVELTAAGVRLAAHDAFELAVLEQLAERAGFEIDAQSVEPRRVTLRLTDVPLADAIGALLAPTPYGIDYRFDAGAGVHEVALVRVGAAASARSGTGDRVEGSRVASEDERASGDDAGRSGSLSERVARESGVREPRRGERVSLRAPAVQDPETAAALVDPDPRVRAEAVGDMETEGEALPDVVDLAVNDPSPAVRTAAVEALGDEGTHMAVEALLATLDDPDPQVLLAAIEAIEMTGDESILGRVAPLTQHSSPAVREAAQEALEFLE
jgi:hypothetical protein